MPDYKSFRGPVSPEATLLWAWDLDGYTVVRQVAAFDGPPTNSQAERLASHPPTAVAKQIALLCGTSADIHGQASTGPEWDGWGGQDETTPIDYVLDSAPSYLSGRGSDGGWVADVANPAERRRLEYNTVDRPPNDDHVASVLGLRCIYCTPKYCTPPPDAGESQPAPSRRVLVAPASHKGQLQPPSAATALAMGALVQVELFPGDCLIAAATTLIALPPGESDEDEQCAMLLQLILAEASVANKISPETEAHMPRDGWHAELSDAQRRLMAPRPVRAGVPAAEIASKADRSEGVDPAELWHWDTFGYLVIPNVMDTGRSANINH